jgi:hypothetical protein
MLQRPHVATTLQLPAQLMQPLPPTPQQTTIPERRSCPECSAALARSVGSAGAM